MRQEVAGGADLHAPRRLRPRARRAEQRCRQDRQSGADLLRFADLQEDAPLLSAARALAPRLLAEFPEIAQAQVQRWLGGKAELLKA